MITFIQVTAIVIAIVCVMMSVLLFARLRWPAVLLWFIKLYVSATSPLFVLLGLVVATAGITTGSVFISLTGVYTMLVFSMHIYRITRPPTHSQGFDKTFGPGWKRSLSLRQTEHFLPARTTLLLPKVPTPRMEKDISFSTIPGTKRQLLCDIWQPASGVPASGLAFIYLHGSAFYFLDKDFGTRPLFNQLTSQGHVIMDVAYRLSPETDIMGMVNDVNRAIVWMRDHASKYGVNPQRIVLGGGSSGGHLALLTAYTSTNPQFTPWEIRGKDNSVCAVVSLYGTSDLKAIYYHTNQHLTTRTIPGKPKKKVPTKMPGWIVKKMGKEFYRLGMNKGFENAGAMAPLLGGHPDDCPEQYARFSPVNHVHAGCPTTFLLHGEHDIMAPVSSTRLLHSRLVDEKVPVILHILPQTDHAFDLILPKISPSAHTAIYELERFLAFYVNAQVTKKYVTKERKELVM